MQNLSFRPWLALVTLVGCHFGDSPGLLGKYTAEQSSQPETADAQPVEVAAERGRREPATPDASVAGPPELKASARAVPSEVCRNECLILTASAEGGEGRAMFQWSGGASLVGPGPHRVCPKQDESYRVVASDGKQSSSASLNVRVRDDCDAAEDAGVLPDPVPATRPTDWTMLGYDLGSTYYNSAERVLTKSNVARLRLKFSVDLGQEVYGAPLLVGERLYVNAGHQVRSYNLATGDELWRHELADSTLNTMAYDEGTLYVHQLNATVAALSAATGQMLWTVERDPADAFDLGYSSPIVAGELVLTGRSNDTATEFRGSLIARRKHDAFMVWRTDIVPAGRNGGGVWSTPSVDLARGLVYVTSTDHNSEPIDPGAGAIMALDLSDGSKQFITQLDEMIISPTPRRVISSYGANPVLYRVRVGFESLDLLAAASRTGTVSALRREIGDYAWTHTLGDGSDDGSTGIYANTTWSGKHILVAYNEGLEANSSLLTALDGGNGKLVWQRQLKGLVLGRITVANGVGFVGAGSAVEVFDIESGASLASLATGGPTAAGVASIANGVVAFGTGARMLNGIVEGARVFVYEVAP